MSGFTAYVVLCWFFYLMPWKLLLFWVLTDCFIVGVLFINEQWRRSNGEKIGNFGSFISVMISDFGYEWTQVTLLLSFIWLAPIAVLVWIYYIGDWIIKEYKAAKERIGQ